MDVLAELLPPSYLVKSENTAKDKKQNAKYTHRNKGGYQALTDTDEQAVSVNVRQASNWDQVERRSGRDRREYLESRGRWLESRAEKDRRQLSKAIQIKI